VQRTSNIFRVVTFPAFYKGLSWVLGSDSSRKRYAAEILKPEPGMKVLDCGCGPASMFEHLPTVDYTGIDLNSRHIEHARALYGDKGRFMVGDVTKDLKESSKSFDLVIVSALLHHLDDDAAKGFLKHAVDLTRQGGRVVTIDSMWLPQQNPVAWALNKLDSGLNVRTAQGYLGLLKDLPVKVETRTYRDLLRVPYDHFCMTLIPQT
jgi:SAM-dependent methyltransferase